MGNVNSTFSPPPFVQSHLEKKETVSSMELESERERERRRREEVPREHEKRRRSEIRKEKAEDCADDY